MHVASEARHSHAEEVWHSPFAAMAVHETSSSSSSATVASAAEDEEEEEEEEEEVDDEVSSW